MQQNYVIKTAEVKKTRNGKQYLDLQLTNREEEIAGKLWDYTDEYDWVQAQTAVTVDGEREQWQGKPQVNIRSLSPLPPELATELVPTVPESVDELLEEIADRICRIRDRPMRRLVERLFREKQQALRYWPAAQSHHHDLHGGLAYHIATMLRVSERLLEVYGFLDADLLTAGIVLHDLAKTEEMQATPLGMVTDYTTEGQLLGHIVQGIKDIERTAAKLETDRQTVLLLEHMILSHHHKPEWGSPKPPMIPEAELLHYIDRVDARMWSFLQAQADVPDEHGFSGRQKALDQRKVYIGPRSQQQNAAH